MDQLDRYGDDFEQAVDALTFEEIAPRRVGSGPVRPLRAERTRGQRSPLLIGLVAAAVVLIVGVAVAVLVRSPSLAPSEPVPTTTSPTTTLASTAPSPTTTFASITEPDAEAPVLIAGQIEWQAVSGNSASVPSGYRIRATSDGGFVASESGYRYTSSDGISWNVTELEVPDGVENPQFVDVDGDTWLIDYPTMRYDKTVGIYRFSRNELVKVDLDLGLPAIEGLVWSSPTFSSLAGSGDIRILQTQSTADVPWGDIFGTFENPDLGPAPEALDPAVWWVLEERQFLIGNPISGDEIATVDVDIRSSSPVDIVFTDASSGAEVHRVTGDIPGATEASLLEALGNVFSTALAFDSTWWVSSDRGESFDRQTVPWPASGSASIIDTRGDGLLAWWTDFAPQASSELWRSQDGLEWELVGRPQFDVEEGFDKMVNIGAQDDEFVARVSVIRASNGEEERTDYWHSPDGATWGRLGTVPGGPNVTLTSVGWVAVDLDGVLISTDFENWMRIGEPPFSESQGEEEVGFSGSVSGTVAGDVVFYWVGSDESGERTLWVGRLTR